MTTSGYAPVNGLNMYWESQGDGDPVIVVHGGYGTVNMLGDLARSLSASRRVISVELQGHGHTGDIDRPLTWEGLGDDLAELVGQLGLGQADLVGVSLGSGASLRAAIQHPDVIRRLVAVSFPFRRDGWYPEVRANFDQMGRAGFEYMKQSPVYAEYAKVAPDPDAFPALMDKMGELTRQPFDWTEEVKALPTPTLLVFADADSVPTGHIADFYALLGGGLADANWDGTGHPRAHFAVLPGTTHYDVFRSSLLGTVVEGFLAAPAP